MGLKRRCLSLGPSPHLLHSSPDADSSFCRAANAEEVVVFKRSFYLVLSHAIGVRGNTEDDVGGGGTVLVLGGGPETLKGMIR